VRVLVAPDKFRGSLSAAEAAAAMAEGARLAGHEQVRELPMADGGEGFTDVLVRAAGGSFVTVTVSNALGEPVQASYGMLPGGRAVVETAKAVGLDLVSDRNDPVKASSRGAGELLSMALDAGVTQVLVGVGGSAMTDGGCGALEALNWSLRGADVRVACDVTTPFLDAARLFGPQKGASTEQVKLLTGRLKLLAEEYRERTGVDIARMSGAGAAGGLSGGLAAIGATLVPGFDLVADALDLDEALRWADVVVTGEGSLDATSFNGKVVGEVLARAAAADVAHRVAIAGRVVGDEVASLGTSGVHVLSLTDRAEPTQDPFASAYELLRASILEALLDLTA